MQRSGVRSPVAPLTLDNSDDLSLAPPRLVAPLLASAPLGDRGSWDGHGGSDSRRSPHGPPIAGGGTQVDAKSLLRPLKARLLKRCPFVSSFRPRTLQATGRAGSLRGCEKLGSKSHVPR